MILPQAQQHRIVDDPAVLGRDEHVLALPHLALVEVARHEHVGERERIGPGDLHLPLHADVPERHVPQQRPVLLDRVAVLPGMVGVVVHAVVRHPVLPRGIEVGRLADARIQQDLRLGLRNRRGAHRGARKVRFRHRLSGCFFFQHGRRSSPCGVPLGRTDPRSTLSPGLRDAPGTAPLLPV